MRVLTLINDKGGCGKTTTAIHWAGALAARGRRVLLVDIDPQAHATLGLSCDASEGLSIHEVLRGRCEPRHALRHAPGDVTLLPSHARLAEFEEVASRALGSERALARALRPLETHFDDCLVDCPPRAGGLLAANALRATTTAVLVVETGAFALQGALRALAILERFREDNAAPFDVRVVATMFDRQIAIEREILVALHARLGPRMFDTAIGNSARLREAAARGLPIQVLAPRSSAAADFAALASESLGERRAATAVRV
jgi:chromosome partitioning protein